MKGFVDGRKENIHRGVTVFSLLNFSYGRYSLPLKRRFSIGLDGLVENHVSMGTLWSVRHAFCRSLCVKVRSSTLTLCISLSGRNFKIDR